jgi:hypothetical protein
LPTASFTHLVSKLDFAAPASFLSAEAFWQLAAASLWHFVMKLFRAAPASFFAAAWSWQLGLASAATGPIARMVIAKIANLISILLPLMSSSFWKMVENTERCKHMGNSLAFPSQHTQPLQVAHLRRLMERFTIGFGDYKLQRRGSEKVRSHLRPLDGMRRRAILLLKLGIISGTKIAIDSVLNRGCS